jgi:hypothetical protein
VLREKTRRAVSTLPKAQKKHPLLGLLTDEQGRKYKAVHTTKRHRRYRYYVAKATDDGTPGNRYPADELERHVVGCIETFLVNTQKVLEAVVEPTDDARATEQAVANLEAMKMDSADMQASATWRTLLHGVRIESRAVHVRIDRGRLRLQLGLPESAAGQEATIDLHHPLRLHRTAHELRLVIPSDGSPEEATKRDESLVRFIARGRHWYRQITRGEMRSIQAIAKAEGVTERYVARVLRGSLMAPVLMQKILDGQQPISLTGRSLLDPPSSHWGKQVCQFGHVRGKSFE